MSTDLAMAFPPGEFLAEELEARGWTQADFAEIIGRPAQLVSGIVSGKKEITRDTALDFAAAFNTSAEYWLNLQNLFELKLKQSDPAAASRAEDVKTRARMNELAPVAVLRRRGVLPEGTLKEQVSALCDLLEIRSLTDEPTWAAAAKRQNHGSPVTPTQQAWVAITRGRARTMTVEGYDHDGLISRAEGLSRRVLAGSDFVGLPSLFAEVGVRLVYEEALPGSRIDGAAFLLNGDPNQPVIALSGRGKRFDKVLFTLLHEVAHVVNGDLDGPVPLIDEDGGSHSDREEAANKKARGWCLPEEISPPVVIRRPWVKAEATRLGVHPLLLVGRLQKEGKLDWRTELVRGAENVDSQLARWNLHAGGDQ
ncbi:HTH-type transcriptional regulator / antitoxin HigA [Austwickia chelonae]|uniref:Putative transcriptional regulator n=1 Tax=Austwickia chelonae NBRC 105200 TaxID=1184607 RepID=K6VTV9_9MICO|nr:HigA family addiction module antitoxin [Austwickia chelonae]GAB78780.1 putative transcriptional regulator [Austwickia chelonae NBRC 105200]SEW35376.1 HTH-type transcriptional regulator / antitoxin HigA [Austwickia chelonae]